MPTVNFQFFFAVVIIRHLLRVPWFLGWKGGSRRRSPIIYFCLFRSCCFNAAVEKTQYATKNLHFLPLLTNLSLFVMTRFGQFLLKLGKAGPVKHEGHGDVELQLRNNTHFEVELRWKKVKWEHESSLQSFGLIRFDLCVSRYSEPANNSVLLEP